MLLMSKNEKQWQGVFLVKDRECFPFVKYWVGAECFPGLWGGVTCTRCAMTFSFRSFDRWVKKVVFFKKKKNSCFGFNRLILLFEWESVAKLVIIFALVPDEGRLMRVNIVKSLFWCCCYYISWRTP